MAGLLAPVGTIPGGDICMTQSAQSNLSYQLTDQGSPNVISTVKTENISMSNRETTIIEFCGKLPSSQYLAKKLQGLCNLVKLNHYLESTISHFNCCLGIHELIMECTKRAHMCRRKRGLGIVILRYESTTNKRI